jgi:hypothetical protein
LLPLLLSPSFALTGYLDGWLSIADLRAAVRHQVCVSVYASVYASQLHLRVFSASLCLSLFSLTLSCSGSCSVSLRLSRSLSERGNPKGEGEVKSVRNSPPVCPHSLPALLCLILPASDSFFCVVGRCGEMCRQPAFSRRQFPRFVCARALVRLATHGSHDLLPRRYHCIPLCP